MHLPWRQKQQASEECTPSLPSEQRGLGARWSATKDAFKTHVATAQANTKYTLQRYNANVKDCLRAKASEECTPSLPSEQRGLGARWSATKDAFKTHVATAQANTKYTLQRYNDSVKDRLRAKAYQLGSRPVAYLVLSGFFLALRYFRRLRTAEWVTPDILQRKRWVRGVVTSVGDADNFRLYHTPGFGWRWPLKFRRQTIHVRIAGVDAPEGSHFGRQAQPYAVEALAWLKDAIEGRIVYCQLVRRDQYSRIVSVVTLSPPFFPGWLITGRSLALEMIRAGTGLTYEQAGAEYGKYGKDEFLRAEAESRVARRGMWKHGTVGETPAQYKRRYAQSGTDIEAQVQGTAKVEKENSKEGGLRRILKRLWS
ncbi:hypothetical protein DFJ58DRAFT_789701 [Suillus subalutaceus]|uniref:uncharacterized protein n=1 Tax=Suillus subalutaceus TaxID=48586 RepID=UPI001B86B2D7|nr:uncharacterized protein DFJ58DRAFT_789701 [Suillus subalutaceus]KAG1853147.1 hypothetical protein DFJ58DRAFT_789701 [Suillus subalutaceus]